MHEVQPLKAYRPTMSTEAGIAMLSKDARPSKALQKIILRESGKAIVFKEEHFLKAASSIAFTFGNLTSSNFVQFSKTLL